MWTIIGWYDYTTFNGSFDDLYKQLDDENKYLISYLQESIPLEGGWGFFDTLLSIFNNIYYKKHNGIYPSHEQCFILATEYIIWLYTKWIVKVKLSTPVIKSLPRGELREGCAPYKYIWENIRIYINPEEAKELQRDMIERYSFLWNKEWAITETADLRTMYTMTGIYISYWDRPFYDEICNARSLSGDSSGFSVPRDL